METEKIQKKASWLISCPNCFAINNNLAELCHQCNSRIGSNLSPLGIVQSEGEIFRKVVSNRPKPLVLFFVWLIFLPVTVTGLGLAFNQAIYDRGANGFIAFWFGIFTAMIGIYFLFKVTKNYFTMKEKSFNQNDELV